MKWLVAAAEFVYDFLADDGWEILAGLAILLPLTLLVARHIQALAGVLMVAGIVLIVAVSLRRRLPRSNS